MVERAPAGEFAVEDLSLDKEGRIIITSPVVAARLLAATKRPNPPAPKEPSNGNCNGCNTTAGCGPSNSGCTTNTVKNCGGTKIEGRT
ncbi:MAG TPA: hypothetical protein VH684_12730 [Xanthobacteraceae bacterium]|jgi:hypothetical protein